MKKTPISFLPWPTIRPQFLCGMVSATVKQWVIDVYNKISRAVLFRDRQIGRLRKFLGQRLNEALGEPQIRIHVRSRRYRDVFLTRCSKRILVAGPFFRPERINDLHPSGQALRLDDGFRRVWLVNYVESHLVATLEPAEKVIHYRSLVLPLNFSTTVHT
jgi:hypothetical protein